MQMSAAMPIAFSTMSCASRFVFSASARAAESANEPPEPMAADVVLGLDHVAVAGDDEQLLLVAHQQQRLEASQIAVAAPVLREVDGGARDVAELLELAFEALEQREGIRRAAGKAREHLVVVEAAHLAGVALHDGVAEGDLPVAAHGDRAVLADGQDGRAVRIETRGFGHDAPDQQKSRLRCGEAGSRREL